MIRNRRGLCRTGSDTILKCTSDTLVSFPHPGLIRIQSHRSSPTRTSSFRKFLESVFGSPEVTGVVIGGNPPEADLLDSPQGVTGLKEVVGAITRRLDSGKDDLRDTTAEARPAQPHTLFPEPTQGPPEAPFRIAATTTARDFRGTIRYFRHGSVISGWELLSELPGRLRLRNQVLLRRKPLCRAIERDLTGIAGFDRFKANAVSEPCSSTTIPPS